MSTDRGFWNDIGLLIVRVTFSVLLLFHGWHKVHHGLDSTITRLTDATFLPGFLAYFISVAEVLAPLLIIFGLFARLSALLIFVTMTLVMYIIIAGGVTISAFGVPNFESQAFYWLLSGALVCTGAGRFRLQFGNSKHWACE